LGVTGTVKYSHTLFSVDHFQVHKSCGRQFLMRLCQGHQHSLYISPKPPFKVQVKLYSKSFWFPPTRLILSSCDCRLKHLAIMEEKDRDVIAKLQVNGLAQFFRSEELESRMTHFQEEEDDEDIPTENATKQATSSINHAT
jgi:hypothetical protein